MDFSYSKFWYDRSMSRTEETTFAQEMGHAVRLAHNNLTSEMIMKSNILEVKKAGSYLGDLQGVIVTVKDLYAGIEERAIAGEKVLVDKLNLMISEINYEIYKN